LFFFLKIFLLCEEEMEEKNAERECLELRRLLKLCASGLASPRTLTAMIPPEGQFYSKSEPVTILNRVVGSKPSRSSRVLSEAIRIKNSSRGVDKYSPSRHSVDSRRLF